MKENKVNIFLLITTIFSTVIILLGATFSYFSTRNMSKLNAIAVEAGKVRLGLGVSSLYTDHKLIPTNDEDIMIAYNNKCVDDYGFGACLVYEFEVYNYNNEVEVAGTIEFTINHIDNLSYMVLDENNNIYLDKVLVGKDNDEELSLGNSFTLNAAPEIGSSSRKFKLVIWLTNLEEDQNEFDAGGNFTAAVTFKSIYGGRLTATIEGYESNENNVSTLGGN